MKIVSNDTELVRKPTGIYWARGTDPNSTEQSAKSILGGRVALTGIPSLRLHTHT